jgi:S1-C subfamily serine protease
MVKPRLLLKLLAMIALVSSLSPGAATAAMKVTREFRSGAWAIGVYADENSGAFMFCIGASPDRRDVVMSVALDPSYRWGLVFSAERWLLSRTMDIPVRVRIDTGPWFDTNAIVMSRRSVYVPVSQNNDLLDLFRDGQRLQLYDGGNLYFDLAGTKQLMSDLAACVAAELAKRPPAAPSSAAPQAATSAAAEPTTDAKNEERQVRGGSGIFISDLGHVLTNSHVIERCGKIRVRRSADVEAPATIVARDTTNDLALLVSDLHIEAKDVAVFRVTAPVRAGESIAVYGFPLPGALSSSGNIVSGDVTALAGLDDDARYFEISAPVQPGNSGGPLLDFSGLVVGIVNAKPNGVAMAAATGDLQQTVNFAIKESVITSFLEAHSVAYQSRLPANKLDLPAIADRAQQFTALVVCVP